jgi:hypothetical protein
MIIKDVPVYDGLLIHKRFAYNYFRKKTLPIGNIVAFRAPMNVLADGMIDSEDILQNDFIYSDDAVNFCWEIPNLDPFGAVAWQRLFNTQIANIVSSMIKKPIEVDGDDLLVHDNFEGSDGSQQNVGKCSVSITVSKNNVVLGHTGININAGRKAPNFAYSTKLTDAQVEQFMKVVIDMFYALNDDIFIATTKVIA